jgi:hypothetical protein
VIRHNPLTPLGIEARLVSREAPRGRGVATERTGQASVVDTAAGEETPQTGLDRPHDARNPARFVLDPEKANNHVLDRPLSCVHHRRYCYPISKANYEISATAIVPIVSFLLGDGWDILVGAGTPCAK